MDDLMAYAGRNDIQIVALSAIAHAQFKTIHPFTDVTRRPAQWHQRQHGGLPA